MDAIHCYDSFNITGFFLQYGHEKFGDKSIFVKHRGHKACLQHSVLHTVFETKQIPHPKLSFTFGVV